MKKIFLLLVITTLISCKSNQLTAQQNNNISKKETYWQQHVDYKMDIDMDVENFQYTGDQTLVYTNNSPDDLDKVYYHLYFNAFQPGSEMDIRLQNIEDPDGRMIDADKKSRIASLKPNQIGYEKVLSLTQDGKDVTYKVYGTILKVSLNHPIKSGEKSTFKMKFKGQVPVQIRRSGRNNAEGVALSMTQWYPKLAEYDFEGWHPDQYVAREFFGVWGDFDVTIRIDKDYILGGTGYLQNPQEIGYGYEEKGVKVNKPKGKKLTWHFKAPNVHDFTWAADKEYIHDVIDGPYNTKMHFLYKKDVNIENWKALQKDAYNTMDFYNNYIGNYPYKQYSIIQGGDGGMEYGMCTLITGKRNLNSLKGVVRHEMAHSWFQFVLATNESEHPWMDEGFTSFANTIADQHLDKKTEFPFERVYQTYSYLVKSGKNEPLTTQGDRYNTNMAYGINSYYKGQMFLSQLIYLIGRKNLDNTLKKYYNDWKFKHPNPNDITREAEKISGLELHWYLNEWVETTHIIDYGIEKVEGKSITLKRIGEMPMSIDLRVTYTDDSTEDFYIPTTLLLGNKPTTATILKDWAWAIPSYQVETSKEIKSVEIDPSKLMWDLDMSNNKYEVK
ncbi:MAG TPA: M1 family peptidase [Flavobacteriia bacterium]|nr:M1 family peptidase [Flavobacteriia bacterium]